MLFIKKSYDFNSYKHKINKQNQNKIHDWEVSVISHVLFLCVVLGLELGLTSHILPVCCTTGLHLQTHFNFFFKKIFRHVLTKLPQ